MDKPDFDRARCSVEDREEALKQELERTHTALRSARVRLIHLLSIFESPYFTDRYNDAAGIRRTVSVINVALGNDPHYGLLPDEEEP